MNICLIMDNPETPRHPVIGATVQRLRATHTVRLLDVRSLTGRQAVALEARSRCALADLYLLKSHAPPALELAHALEQRGAVVVNSWASTLACQDRLLMTWRMREAGLPWPRTRSFATLGSLLAQRDLLATLPFPLILKSRYSHRGDLVAKAQTVEQVRDLAGQWSQEPIIAQEFAAGDGWDIKIWVIDGQIFAARRRTPLGAAVTRDDFPVAADDLPHEWARLALEVGRAFNLRLYGLDVLLTARGAMIVDVNAFPGFRGVPGAADALVALVEHRRGERGVTR